MPYLQIHSAIFKCELLSVDALIHELGYISRNFKRISTSKNPTATEFHFH